MIEPGGLRVSVLVASWKRADRLAACLRGLAAQTRRPDQVVVAWQADDTHTRDRAAELAAELPLRIDVVHCPVAGIVPAENAALDAADGDLIAMIDDDAVARPDWIARFVPHFADPTVGAVGGPAVNYMADGAAFPLHPNTPHGLLPWHGRLVGNMYDHPPEWAARPPIEVDHLVGYNMVLRRSAFGRFEVDLRRYWQLFELEACLQVKANGLRVMFDFANVVDHYPTNTAYVGGRDGDLQVKIDNAAYNAGFILGKHSPWPLVPVRIAIQLAVGRVDSPGLVAFAVACRRYGRVGRELRVLWRTWRATLAGWRAGLRRRSARRSRRVRVT